MSDALTDISMERRAGQKEMPERQVSWTGGAGCEPFVHNVMAFAEWRYHMVPGPAPEAEQARAHAAVRAGVGVLSDHRMM
ncbi:hypothetical protein [Streptomyces werraensis]|uniref:hypothetical protein n=1 Tax=Streptomyces werraensis TaxID=68284 RepID=UPI001CE3A610